MEWTSIATIVGAITGVIALATTWLSGKFNTIDLDMKAIIKRMDQKSDELHARIDQANERIDQANSRIDLTQNALMKMVEKLGK
jgi:outer membrane murein-binding lipoprotein Lpp